MLNKKSKSKDKTTDARKSTKKKKKGKIPLNDIEMEGGSSLGSADEETKNQKKQNNSRFSQEKNKR